MAYLKKSLKVFTIILFAERLGFGNNGANDVKAHPWFSKVDWNAIA